MDNLNIIYQVWVNINDFQEPKKVMLEKVGSLKKD